MLLQCYLDPLPIDAVKLEVLSRRIGVVTAAANQGVHGLPLFLARLCILNAKLLNIFAFEIRKAPKSKKYCLNDMFGKSSD